jgi:light-regulated signal transduction histidine kinase (bacteriophytochrome)
MQLLARRYRGALDGDAHEFIDFAVGGAARMQRLIEDLLTFSRVTTRGHVFEPTDAAAVLDDVLAGLHTAIEESGATVTCDRLPVVNVDQVQFGQVLANLVGNALKFQRDAAPCVHVSARRDGRFWLFDVRDNGIGIEPQYFDRIFAIFQRLHGRDEYPGTGIGLALCRKIVERHGGRIRVASTPGAGTTFSFTIPAVAE